MRGELMNIKLAHIDSVYTFGTADVFDKIS
jgi:hypothetical protein